jgi:hypothetical protein
MSDTKLCINLIRERRKNIIKFLLTFSIPKDIANLVSDFDYYLEGTPYTFSANCTNNNCIAILPDDRIVIGGNQNRLQIWDLQTDSFSRRTRSSGQRSNCLSSKGWQLVTQNIIFFRRSRIKLMHNFVSDIVQQQIIYYLCLILDFCAPFFG